MKPLRSLYPRPSNRFQVIGDTGLALLLAAGLLQIVLCLGATTNLVPDAGHVALESKVPKNQAPDLLARELNGAAKKKSLDVKSATDRG